MRINLKQRLYAVAALAGVVGVALAPLAVSAATDSENTTINANLGSAISLTTTGTVTLNITPVSGGSQTSASDTVTVNTNNTGGYNLAVRDADANTNLVNGVNNIAASGNSFATAGVLANNSWGWAVASGTPGIGGNGFDASYATITNAPTSSTNWVGMTTSDQVFKSTSSVATNDTTTVWYSAKADTSNPNGTYTNVVTYTATTN